MTIVSREAVGARGLAMFRHDTRGGREPKKGSTERALQIHRRELRSPVHQIRLARLNRLTRRKEHPSPLGRKIFDPPLPRAIIQFRSAGTCAIRDAGWGHDRRLILE